MKAMVCLLIVAGHFLFSAPLASADPINEQHVPRYAKWGTLANQAAHSKYPKASIVDFLYVGCKALSPTTTNQIYKFWMKEGNREFGVYVTLSIDMNSDKIIKTSIEATDVLIPAYGKWRRLAVQATQVKFPNAVIMDYRPFGCKTLSTTTASQTYKFWLEQNEKWMVIFTTIVYEIKTEKVFSVDFEKDR